MLPPKVQAVVDKLLALFESGDVPKALAHATFPRLDVPSANWSFRNRLLMLLQGTEDARGFRQWKTVSRSVKKGVKAVHILAPAYREYIPCPNAECKARYFLRKNEQQPAVCSLCGASLKEVRIRQQLRGFRVVPVFRREDTEGEPLEDELLPVPQHNFIALAEQWGIIVKAQGFSGGSYGSFSQRQQTILLSSPDPEVFYHELAHAAHARITKLRAGQDARQEIVAEFVAATLAALDGREAHVGTSYEYLESYASKIGQGVERAVFTLLGEIEAVLGVILSA